MSVEYISIEGAAQRLGMSTDEVCELIEKRELEHRTYMGVTSVTKESVYAYSGISTSGNQTKKKGKGGRPPATVSYVEAALMLNEDIRSLIGNDDLETYDTGDDLRITQRSIKAYKKKLADAEVNECEAETDKGADPLDLDEDVTDTDVGESEELQGFCTYPKCNCPFDIGEDHQCFKGLSSRVEPLVDLTDFTGMEEQTEALTQNEEIELSEREKETTHENVVPDEDNVAELKQEFSAKEEAMQQKEELVEEPLHDPRHDSEEETINITKSDFHAAMSLAGMRAELGVYRSLKALRGDSHDSSHTKRR